MGDAYGLQNIFPSVPGSQTGSFSFSPTGLTAPRVYTLPDLNDQVVTLTATQTLSNKTLASPIVTGSSTFSGSASFTGTTTFSTITIGTNSDGLGAYAVKKIGYQVQFTGDGMAVVSWPPEATGLYVIAGTISAGTNPDQVQIQLSYMDAVNNTLQTVTLLDSVFLNANESIGFYGCCNALVGTNIIITVSEADQTTTTISGAIARIK